MYFLTDTCFWTHIKEIFDQSDIDLRSDIDQFKWGFPNSVIIELDYYQVKEWIHLDDAYILPISKTEYNISIKKYPFLKELDLADQELIFIAQREKSIILTDDGELASSSISMGIDTLRLPEFIVFLYKNRFLEKKTYNQIFQVFNQMKRYKQNELKRWKNLNFDK